MSDEAENLTLTYLRRLDAKMDRVIDDLADVKSRLTAVGEAVMRLAHRVDRLELRVDRVERRLDLVDVTH